MQHFTGADYSHRHKENRNLVETEQQLAKPSALQDGSTFILPPIFGNLLLIKIIH
jgi:hypothetical protein